MARGRPRKRASKSIRAGASARSAFPIVGIGASAGGLEALTAFFESLPAEAPLAFVVIQHLDPTQKGMMPELLQRATRLTVAEATDRLRVRPGHVYVIPPNRDLAVRGGRLRLFPPGAPRGLRLPIDFFFLSLAEDRGNRSIGLVFSGMGSDGTRGLQAIKEAGGFTLVQDPRTAKFDSMPRNAVEGGLADFIGAVEEMPAKLIAYERHRPVVAELPESLTETVRRNLKRVLAVLRIGTGHDFELYRESTLARRIHRRMGIHQLETVSQYVCYLQDNPQEVLLLFKELLIGVTGFFRDPASWNVLAQKALPALVRRFSEGGTIRAWVAGCSSGEEAYTLAMVLVEALERIRPTQRVLIQVYATDLDKDAIEKARRGLFPESIATDISPARLKRFFVRDGRGYRVSSELRGMIVFAQQNLIMDPPFTKLDLLTCRNLLIYLTPDLQKKIFPLFHYSLKPDGVLFLGSSESLGNAAELFQPLRSKERIFLRHATGRSTAPMDFPAVHSPSMKPVPSSPAPIRRPVATLQGAADRLLQGRFAPPAVLANAVGDILYVSGRTGRYLEPAAGKANWNLLVMAREELRLALNSAWDKLRRRKGPVLVEGIRVSDRNGDDSVSLAMELLDEPADLRGLILVIFSSTPLPAAAPSPSEPAQKKGPDSTTRELEYLLRQARDEIQAGREEMQTSQEELMSTNEELQSTNEELQSTNEELTTSKEEMQSLNEELQTVNAELQTKLDELSGATDDMKNLLDSTDIATVFLDDEFKVRRYTLQAKKLIKLIPGDIGRPITDLGSDLVYPNLLKDCRAVTRSLTFMERAIPTTSGRWFNVRVMPYRTAADLADGFVITFTDVTGAKVMEAELRATNGKLAERTSLQAKSHLLEINRLNGLTKRGAALPKKSAPARPKAG